MAKLEPIPGIDGAYKTEDGVIVFKNEKETKSIVEKREEEKQKLFLETKSIDLEERIKALENKLNIVIEKLIDKGIINSNIFN